jgi:uncharacterized repeat protein (TIGR01451 family)
MLFVGASQDVQAAPAVQPWSQVFTGTTFITHTNATTHEMRVYGDGRITNRFLTDNVLKSNQIADSLMATTLAIVFDQHPGNSVDVGRQNEFTMARPITLETASALPGAIEDTYTVYASQSLPYQVTQRTLALSNNNCVIMELFIRNTGGTSLTGGKLLYMVDVQAGEIPAGDAGHFDPSRSLLSEADYNADTDNGYAVGISLLEGSLRGYGARTMMAIPDPGSDVSLRNEMNSPSNNIVDGPDNVIWLVADIPDLIADQETKLAFSLCARSVVNPGALSASEMQLRAREALFVTYSNLVNLAVSKAATPPSGSSLVAGEPLTYTIAVTSVGEIYVDNIVITDRVPLSTSLLSYSVSQGSITATNGLVTATVGRLYPASETVVMSLVVAPLTSTPNGTIITNQAFIKGQPIVTRTNVVSHQIIGVPAFSLSKAGQSSPAPVVGLPFTYTLTVTNTGGNSATNVQVVDPLPAGASYVSGGTLGAGNVVSWTIPSLAAGGRTQVSYVVTTCQMSLVNNNYQVINSSQGITSAPGAELISALAPPTLTPNFVFSPLQPGIGQSVSFTSTSSANGTPLVSWNWNFGDGNTGSGQTISHAYTVPGNYSVALTMTDRCNYQATVTKTVTIFVPNLVVTKQASPEPVSAGSRLTYTITLTNEGPVEATGVVVSDPLPAHTTFVPGSLVINPPSVGGILGVPPMLVSNLTLTPGFRITTTYQVTVTAPLTNGTLITNTVSVSSSQVPTPTVRSITSTVSSSPDLDLTKVSTHPIPLQPGNLITYSLILRNNGNANATGVVISDSLPAHTDFVAGSISLNPPTAGQVGTAPPLLASNVNLAVGASLTVTYRVRARTPLTNGTTITNTASVTSTQTPTLVTDTVVDTVSSSPALAIRKTASYAAPLSPGETLTYTIVVSNSGNANATGGVISDTLPANLSLVPGSLDLEPDSAGTLGSFPFLATNLRVAAGQRVTLTFAGMVAFPLANGTIITNTASVTSQEQLLPQASTVTATTVAVPNIQVEKMGPISANVLSTVIYTFTVTNVGNTPLQGIQLVDDHLGPVTNLRPGSDSNGNNQLDLNETWVYTDNYIIPIGAPRLTNTVTVTATDGLFSTATDRDSHVVLIGYNPVLTITKTGPSSATVGSPVVFTFRVRHAPGSDNTPVREVKVNDNVAGPATFTGGDTNNNSQLDLNEIWSYTVNYTVKPSNPNPLINTGTVTARDIGNETVTAVATHSTSLSGFDPRLFVDKDGPPMAEVGTTAVYTITVINVNSLALTKFNLEKKISIAAIGDGSPVTGVSVTDSVATNVVYIRGDFNGNGKLDGAEAWTYRASHTITRTDPDPLVNVATVSVIDQENEPITATDSHSTNIAQDPILEITNTGSTNAQIGKEVELTFTVGHAAGSDGSGVGNVTAKIIVGDKVNPAIRTAGDLDNDNILDGNEQWNYTARYLVNYLDSSPLTIMVKVEARDQDNEVMNSVKTFSISVSSNGVRVLLFPVISKH